MLLRDSSDTLNIGPGDSTIIIDIWRFKPMEDYASTIVITKKLTYDNKNQRKSITLLIGSIS